MRARTLLYILGACSPAFLLALLGISGRFLIFPWQAPEYGPQASHDLLAYADPVAQVRGLEFNDSSNIHAITLVAQTWINGAESGTLKSVPPADAVDYGSFGIRQEIEVAKRKLQNRLFRSALLQAKNNDVSTAVNLHLLNLKVAEIGKYSSPVNIASSAQMQRASLSRLVNLKPLLTPEQQLTLLRNLLKSKASLDIVQESYDHLNALARTENPIPTTAKTRPNFKTMLAQKGATLARDASTDLDQLMLLTSFRQAHSHELSYQTTISEALQAYAPFIPEPEEVKVDPEPVAPQNSVTQNQESVVSYRDFRLLAAKRRGQPIGR